MNNIYNSKLLIIILILLRATEAGTAMMAAQPWQ